MIKKIKFGLIGFVIGCILTTSVPVLADTILQKIDVVLNTVNVQIDGEELNTNNILYNGTTYLPMRSIVEAVGKDIEWNQSSMTANIIDKKEEVSNIIDENKYQEFINNFKIGETISHLDMNEKEGYLNRIVFVGNLNDEEFLIWISKYKEELPLYLEKIIQ